MSRQARPTVDEDQRILILGIYAPTNRMHNQDAYFEEFLTLTKTLDVDQTYTMFMKTRTIDKAYYLTKGKLQEVVDYCQKHDIEMVVCSEILSPIQERNLGELLQCEVVDRTQLILEIFKDAAHTHEGKVQVDIAELENLNTRLAGRGLTMAQQAGFIGGKGPGETEKEKLKRYYATKIKQARKKLHDLETSRHTQRKRRLQSGIPLVSLIGYTNAGKSSILNLITKSDVLVEDKLFATLDPTVRTLVLEDNTRLLVSDTVGFISQLPPRLIEAFKATLDELQYADLLLHVIDVSNPQWREHIEVVHDILDDLDVSTKMLYVFNKIDKIAPQDFLTLEIELASYAPSIVVHTQSKDGIEPLYKALKKHYSPPEEEN
jgi:GTP-binding protein HflX